ncbi:MAG: DUF502 domain-containing protein [Planctomycetes bacterium]|nr:DUF502 domain-containing protein [Planctomycetota bacterium]
MKRIARYFFQGLLFLVPVAVTIFIFYYIIDRVDAMVVSLVPGLDLPFPGAGLVITVVLVTIIGFLASNVLTSWIVRLVDWVFGRLPLVKLLYTSIKDLIGAFVGDQKGFQKPVAVSLVPNGPKVLGFITNEALESLGLAEHVAVYVPQSYNFAGNLLIFPREQIQSIDADSSQVMTFLISGGVSGKEEE